MSKNSNPNPKVRRYLITINNPIEKGFTHEKIKEILEEWSGGLVYWCMVDEVGKNGTFHTHIYIQFKNCIHFNSLQRAFDKKAHIDICHGSSLQNRDYLLKQGKYKGTDKEETNIKESFEEFGDMPNDNVEKKNKSEELLVLIKDGKSNTEIYDVDASYTLRSNNIDKIRQELSVEKFRKIKRNVEVIYICGKTRTGKTTSILEEYGYENVCRFYQYEKNPFDQYNYEDVVVFDEFRSQLNLYEMLSYLQGFPVAFPARFYNRQCCFTKVFVISNWSFIQQYKEVQREHEEDWDAFCSRFQKIRIYRDLGVYDEFDMREYLANPIFYDNLSNKKKNEEKVDLKDSEEIDDDYIFPFL